MNSTDELVNAWLLQRFLDGATIPRYHPVEHGEHDEISVQSADADWECNCYSDYTRDDQFVVEGVLKVKNGSLRIRYGNYADFPVFIEELYAFQNNGVCQYEDEDTGW